MSKLFSECQSSCLSLPKAGYLTSINHAPQPGQKKKKKSAMLGKHHIDWLAHGADLCEVPGENDT